VTLSLVDVKIAKDVPIQAGGSFFSHKKTKIKKTAAGSTLKISVTRRYV